MKALFSSREGHFSLRWIRGILAIKRRACVSLRRDMSGSLACLGTINLELAYCAYGIKMRSTGGLLKGWILLKDLLRAGR